MIVTDPAGTSLRHQTKQSSGLVERQAEAFFCLTHLVEAGAVSLVSV